jgi:1-acyl-sn-glycerol-3-phosphate acyltransferase
LPEIGKQSVFLAAPHTSNWDFVYTIACFEYLKIPVRFTIKKEWLKWPFKKLMYSFGAIAIDRSPKVPGEERLSTVQAMVNLYKEHENLAITVTPEGTQRKADTMENRILLCSQEKPTCRLRWHI